MPALLAMYKVVFTFINEVGNYIHMTQYVASDELQGKADAAMQLGVYQITATEFANYEVEGVVMFKRWMKMGNGEYDHHSYGIEQREVT